MAGVGPCWSDSPDPVRSGIAIVLHDVEINKGAIPCGVNLGIIRRTFGSCALCVVNSSIPTKESACCGLIRIFIENPELLMRTRTTQSAQEPTFSELSGVFKERENKKVLWTSASLRKRSSLLKKSIEELNGEEKRQIPLSFAENS